MHRLQHTLIDLQWFARCLARDPTSERPATRCSREATHCPQLALLHSTVLRRPREIQQLCTEATSGRVNCHETNKPGGLGSTHLMSGAPGTAPSASSDRTSALDRVQCGGGDAVESLLPDAECAGLRLARREAHRVAETLWVG